MFEKVLIIAILVATAILLMIVVKRLTPIIKNHREAFKKALDEIKKAKVEAEEKAEADAEKTKAEENKAEADKVEADAEKAKVEAEEKAETEVVAPPVSSIASELEETYARIDRNTAETMRALEEINVLKKREAKKQSEEKSRSTMAEAKNLYAAVEAVLNTPLDQFQPTTKPTARTVVKIEKKGGDQ